jgi:hypothetical protein
LGDADRISIKNDVFCAWDNVASGVIRGRTVNLLSRIILFDKVLNECNEYA